MTAPTSNLGSSNEEKKDEVERPLSTAPVQTTNIDRNWLLRLLHKHQDTNGPAQPLLHPILKDKALVVAPMVDQSDLPFRLLCRKYGSNLAFTPMVHAKHFCIKPNYAKKFFDVVKGLPPQDRPVVAQFCGSDLNHVVEATRLIAPHVDAIDINCGCPQSIAKRGNYGAFLLEQPEVLLKLVRTLRQTLPPNLPLTVKVRILPTGIEDSLNLYTQLVDAGASMITIHGRTRFEKGRDICQADWTGIEKAVKLLGHRIPILANGSISDVKDTVACLQQTGADGVMASEALLEYPPLFQTWNAQDERSGPGRMQMAQEYMDLARQYPPHVGGQGNGIKRVVRAHLHRFFHADLHVKTDIRDQLCLSETFEEMQAVVYEMGKALAAEEHVVTEERLSWYMRHRGNDDGEGHGSDMDDSDRDLEAELAEQIKMEGVAAECNANFFGGDGEQCGAGSSDY